MNNQFLITGEILVVVVMPLIVLFLRGTWPLRMMIGCLVSIPIVWYLTYAPIHELSHVAGTYMVGGKVISMKLIPRFWMGEFGRAWITSDGITHRWQQLISSAFPYILDVISLAVGMFVLRRDFSKNPFVIGVVFMLLCLRPSFDFVCEAIAFLSGDRGDFYAIQGIVGTLVTWTCIMVSLGLSIFSTLTILKRFVGSQETVSVEAKM